MSRTAVGRLKTAMTSLVAGASLLGLMLSTAWSSDGADKSAPSAETPVPSQAGRPNDPENTEIAWVKEDVSDECTQISYDFPASLVPIQDDAAATGGLYWRSFDQKRELNYETKASYFLFVPRTTRRHFLQTTRCDPNNEMFKGGYFFKNKPMPQVTACEEGANKIRFSVLSKRKFCSTVYIIAPDDKDESRFLANLELCGPPSDANLITLTSHRMFESISMRYLGCCKRTNYVNCYHQ